MRGEKRGRDCTSRRRSDAFASTVTWGRSAQIMRGCLGFPVRTLPGWHRRLRSHPPQAETEPAPAGKLFA